MKLETERLLLREMTENDLDDLKEILMDGPTMYAYEGAFTEEETRGWLGAAARTASAYRRSCSRRPAR